MGLTGSTIEEDEAKTGFHVLRVKPGSPADDAGLEAYFDYIVAIDGVRLSEPDTTLINILKQSINRKVELILYSSKLQQYRTVDLVPSQNWGGDGVLGCSIRFCSYAHAAENVWHVLDVYEDSPASRARLRPFSDYIIGTPSAVIKDKNDLFALIEEHMGKELQLYVYNWESDLVREVVIVPDAQWGGDGSLGCDIGFGYLHRIPNRSNKPNPSAQNGTALQYTHDYNADIVSPVIDASNIIALDDSSKEQNNVNANKSSLSESNLMEASNSMASLPELTSSKKASSPIPVSDDFAPVGLKAQME